MAIIKPTKPDSELPKTWGGTQYPYTEEQIAEGLPEAIPTIIDGGTLNYEKKGVFERMEYVTQVSDAVAGTPIKKTLITNANNQFEYAGIGVYSYSATQVYALDDFVITSTNEGTKIYKSLSNNNIGKELTNETYWEELSLGGGSGLEIGDIGFAVFGIDEAQNKRRYLNGQIISQAQFVSFTNKIKSAIELYPNLATSEENWQAEVTNSKLGQCGKFVIDDTLGTIRLPKVVNINGLQDLALMGSIKAESLPNITGETGGWVGGGISGDNGALYTITKGVQSWGGATSSGIKSVAIDASRSSSTYQDNAPVQQEAIQYPYFIQVATGVEETVDVTREIELNNPFSLLDYKWSEYELNNASWLISNGAFHSGATYVAVYELLLKIYNGTTTKDGVSVKLATEAYEDSDFVLNTVDTTFRLPIKVKLASGNAVVGNGMSLGLRQVVSDSDIREGTLQIGGMGGNNTGLSGTGNIVNTNAAYPTGVTTDPTKSGIETSSSGLKLYFYVGETIQDANVIVASNALTEIANLKSYTTGMPDYSAQIELSVGTTEQTYTVPSKGYIGYNIQMSGNNIGYVKVNDVQVISNRPAGGNYYDFVSGLIPVDKNDVIKYYSNAQPGYFNNFQFYPVKGI